MFSIRNFNYEKMEVIIFSSLGDLTKSFFDHGRVYREKILFLISEI